MTAIIILCVVFIVVVVIYSFIPSKEETVASSLYTGSIIKVKKHIRNHFEFSDKDKYIKDGVISSKWIEQREKIEKMINHFPRVVLSSIEHEKKCAICGNIHIKLPLWELMYTIGEGFTPSCYICTDCVSNWKQWIPENIDNMLDWQYAYKMVQDKLIKEC